MFAAESLPYSSDSEHPINRLVIQPRPVRDLVGFGEDRPGFRGGFVSRVLEEVGERTVVEGEIGNSLDAGWRIGGAASRRMVLVPPGNGHEPGCVACTRQLERLNTP